MRLRDENKRRQIVQTAIRLFSEQPFHKVRLDDVAAAAGVGKGTVYIYFKNKEDLYYSLVIDSFSELVQRLQQRLNADHSNFPARLRACIEELVDYWAHHPELQEVMRTVPVPDANSAWDAKRAELAEVVAGVIRDGVAAGEFNDPKPHHTSLYLLAMVRAVMLYSGKDVDVPALTEHIAHVLLAGIQKTN